MNELRVVFIDSSIEFISGTGIYKLLESVLIYDQKSVL